jgi:hypothetical protein
VEGFRRLESLAPPRIAGASCARSYGRDHGVARADRRASRRGECGAR